MVAWGNTIRGIFTHNEANPPLQKWIRLSTKSLLKNNKEKALGNRIQIGQRQNKNLQRLACGIRSTQQKTPSENDPGCFKCGKCKVSCPILTEGVNFSSTNTKKTYKIHHHLNCDSQFVFYLATCQRLRANMLGSHKRHLNEGTATTSRM